MISNKFRLPVQSFVLFVFFSSIVSASGFRLLGFANSPYFDEQVMTFHFPADVNITINASSPDSFNPELPVCIALFALPNGNTTEQTIGKIIEPGDDWHFDIQHIGAQTRFIRAHVNEYNLVTVYLENDLKSWPAWKAAHSDHAELVQSMVDSVRKVFKDFDNYIVLTGHSGGGRFTFSFLDSYDVIPSYIKRISFLDSDYGYEDYYGKKFVDWLDASDENVLSVIAYNDSVALYNGERVVSDTGGTWYRSKMMQKYLSEYYEFEKYEDDEFIKYYALNNRIEILLKKNPEREILHTVQVEFNGFIQGMFSATQYEGVDYVYYGDRAYNEWIQKGINVPPQLNIPPRPPDAMNGSEFMQSVSNLSFEEREERIFEEISKGNIPGFLRTLTKIRTQFADASGETHSVEYEVMPDYLAIGSNEDYCRIPMGPITAQKLADLFGASMPTRKLVDNIYVNAKVKLPPLTYYPVGNQNELVSKFVQHNNSINHQLDSANAGLGQLVGGIKKDVVISNTIHENHVTIYGWHQLNGSPIQPLYSGHFDYYVDYSHGIRFLNSQLLIDSTIANIRDILTDENLYKILSDESGVMEQPSYLKTAGLPDKPKSFGIIRNGPNQLRLVIESDTNVEYYRVLLSPDGTNINDTVIVNPNNLVIPNLIEDSLYFVKLESVNEVGTSGFTEVLAGIPSSSNDVDLLIVNGFDRTSEGNTFNFIRQHGSAFYVNGRYFNSATNEAVIDGLIDIRNYSIVDYILGDESTADETFNTTEQSIVTDYLNSGGNLFVSGSEVAWDLDYKGSSSDKSFFRNYLKAEYVSDAPYNTQSTYYSIEPVSNNYLPSISSFNFDNGSHGTFNVKWPDVIQTTGGSTGIIKYTSLPTSTGFGGIAYSGFFPGGSSQGKLVYLGFPFETIYPENARIEFAAELGDFFLSSSGVNREKETFAPDKFALYQNYPNPFNPTTTIEYTIPASFSPYESGEAVSGGSGGGLKNPSANGRSDYANVRLVIFDILGRKVTTLVNKTQPPGNYKITFNASNISSGVYYYTLATGEFRKTRKMTILK